MQNNTGEYRGIQRNTEEYRGIKGKAGEYRGIQELGNYGEVLDTL